MSKILNDFKVEVDNKSDLKNGDTIHATLTWGDGQRAEKTFQVSGLETGEVVPIEDAHKAMEVEVSGKNGRGEVSVKWTGRGYATFDIPNNGSFSNGDTAEIYFSDETLTDFAISGYEFSENKPLLYKITGLEIVPTEVDNLNGIDSIKKKIVGFLNEAYSEKNSSYRYDITNLGFYYRQFIDDDTNNMFSTTQKPGQMIGAYKIRKYYRDDNKLSEEFTLLYGYQNIFDEQGNIDMSNSNDISKYSDYDTDIESELLKSGFRKMEK
ncbi:hypothetical protein [Streptococcus marmotae]|uniref:hypothetical protein n=1 Tax=Streptococcus marmotae TaxID=1825069 RepID=UPI0008320D34|nr:hypothetical protein [Streptococcus marmotae]